MKSRKYILLLMLMSVLMLSGCTKKGKLDEGNCKCTVGLEEIPEEFQLLEPQILENLEIKVDLVNLITETKYTVTLKYKDDFITDIYLNQGTYQVTYCRDNMSNYCDVDFVSNVESIKLVDGELNRLTVSIENIESLSTWKSILVPTNLILQEDKFSRMVQFNGEMISLENIMDVVPIESNITVQPYKQEVINSEYGVTITVLNQNSTAVDSSECEVIAVEFNRNRVIFGGGVRLGLTLHDICHGQEGIYKQPDMFSGSPFFGIGFNSMDAIYIDDILGDKITLSFDSENDLLRNIRYEFLKFE